MSRNDAGRLSLQGCPFCGQRSLLAAGPRDDWGDGRWSVSCAACGVVGPLARSQDEAAKHWNALPPYVSKAGQRPRRAA